MTQYREVRILYLLHPINEATAVGTGRGPETPELIRCESIVRKAEGWQCTYDDDSMLVVPLSNVIGVGWTSMDEMEEVNNDATIP